MFTKAVFRALFLFSSPYVTSCTYFRPLEIEVLESLPAHTLTLRDITLIIMPSDSSSAIPAEFQFPETLSNTKSFDTESFKAAIVKDPEA